MSHFVSEGVPIPTMVICDDDPVSRRLVRGVGERLGFEVLAGVNTAIDALHLVLEHQPDVLVLDLSLPGMSGEEIIPVIQEGGVTRVIVHSSFDLRLAVMSGARLFAKKGNIAMLEKQLIKVRGIGVSA